MAAAGDARAAMAAATGLAGDDGGDDKARADGRHLQFVTLAGIVMGLTAIVFIAREKEGTAFALIAASGLGLGAASALVGALLGFLFGIPKTGLLGAAMVKRAQAPGGTDVAAATYTPNTALEEISDWLTKILVGVGLTQLLAIRGAIGALASRLNEQHLPGVGLVAIVIYFAVFGFIVGYAWTRVVLAPMFKRADLRLGVSEIKAVAEDAAKEVHRTRQKLEVLVKETAQAKAEAVSNQMAAGLYDSPNGGYERAIRDAGELLATQGDPRTYTFWVNLAAAHGQRAEAAQKKNDGTEFQDARRDALEAVQKAMLYDVGGVAQGWIRLMLAGSVPEENDLVAFKNDPDFKKLVS